MALPLSIRPEDFDRQISQLSELAKLLRPGAKASDASYFKALARLQRTLLERNRLIGELFSATLPRRQPSLSLGLSPLDLRREQRTLDHAVGLIELPAARVGTYLDVLRELRATNLWWRTKILELELTRQKKTSKETAAAVQAFRRLTVESMLAMLPKESRVPSIYGDAGVRDRDIAMVRAFAAPRVVPNEEREEALMEALAGTAARSRARAEAGEARAAADTEAVQPAPRMSEPPKASVPIEPIERTPHLELSTPAPLLPGTDFVVEVWADTSDLRPGEEGEKLRIDAPGDVKELHLDVSLLASGHFEVVQLPIDKLSIRRGQPESNRLAFKLRVKGAEELHALSEDLAVLGRGTITAAFSYRGHPCGRVWRLVPLEVGTEGNEHSRAAEGELNREHVSKPRAGITIPPVVGAAADIVVDITADYENDGRSYHCEVTTALGKTHGPWKIERGRTADVVSGFMQNFTASNKTPAQRRAALRGAGLNLFRESPQHFQDAFWLLIDKKRPPRTIQVNSEEPHFLWEIMIPNRPGEEWEAPLGVEYAIARWLTGTSTSAPAEVGIENSYVVAPTYRGSKALRYTPQEAKLVCSEFAGEEIAPQTFDQIRSSVKTKPVSLVHFACHGSAGANGTQQALELADRTEITAAEVEGDDVLKHYLRTKHPFVFLNACEVGRLNPSLRSAGGFPAVMMGAEACAVIAPAWSVKDNLSYQVATSFYRELKANPAKPLAAIMREIRRRAYDEGEDSFAAYCFFGNVHAIWTRGRH